LQDIPDNVDLSWVLKAECRDFEISQMFVSAGHVIDPAVREACRRCEVRRECLVHAYAQRRSSGYFGGMSPGQRRDISLSDALEYIEQDTPTEPK
jgi:Transcription factor WhiB